MDVDLVVLAAPRGFCAGVEMAIKALAWMVRVFEPPVYCYHEIVHNQVVVDRFRQMGVVFVDDIDEVPQGAPLMLSAHGSAPEVAAAARARGGAVVNAVCPLVHKVHKEVEIRAGKGYDIVYVGHEGHEEAVGTMAVAPDAVHRIESVEELTDLPEPAGPVAFLAQTTLAVDEWRAIAEAAERRWPSLWTPGQSDLCFATTNRQAALRLIASRCDAVVVIGSENSSNTRALERTARAGGCARVLRVNGADELPDDLTGAVGVIAGASAPEELVDAVVARLAPRQGVEEMRAVDEEEYFPPPRELRKLVSVLSAVAGVAGFAPPDATPARPDRGGEDRETSAAAVLAALTPASRSRAWAPVSGSPGASASSRPGHGLIEEALQLGVEGVAQLGDHPARHSRRTGARWWRQRSADDDRHPDGVEEPRPLGHRPLAPTDADGQHRHPGASGDERGTVEEREHRRAGFSFPFRVDHDRFPLANGVLARPQRLPVGHAPVHGEGSEGRDEAAGPAVSPQRVLAHEAHPASGDAAAEQGVDVGAVDGGEDERAGGGDVLAPGHRHPPEHPAEPLDDGPGNRVPAQLRPAGRIHGAGPGARRVHGAGSIRSRTTLTTSSMLRPVVSTVTASAARARGDASRVESTWSRRAMSAATWSKCMSSISWLRRVARSRSLAVR